MKQLIVMDQLWHLVRTRGAFQPAVAMVGISKIEVLGKSNLHSNLSTDSPFSNECEIV